MKKTFRYTSEQRSIYVEQWKASGLSVSNFSKDKPFSSTSLYKWIKQSTVTEGFVELESRSFAYATQLRIYYPDGVIIEFTQIPSPAYLKGLMAC